MRLKERILGLSKYVVATSFLAMEVFAFIAFSFGASFVLYGSLTLALLVLLILFSIKEIKDRGVTEIIFLLFPLLVFGLITAIGIYIKGHVILGDFTIADQVFIPIALVSMAGCGYLLAINKTFKIKTFLIVIYGALALLTLINLFANLINFGPFYTIIYKGYYMYYAGKRSSVPVNEIAYTLEGLKFIEAEMSHYVLYPALLLTSVFMLFKVNPKENKRDFIIFLSFAVIACLAFIFVPSKLALVAVGMIALIAGVMFLCYKVKGARKVFKIILIIGIIGAATLLLVMLMNNSSALDSFRNFVAGNSFLNRLLNTNSIVSRYNITLTDILGPNFLGFVQVQKGALSPELVNYSGSIFFDTFMTSGLIGVALIVFVCILGLKSFKRFFLEDSSEVNIKITLLGLVVLYILYCSLFYQGEYGVYYYINTPYFMSGPFLVVLFILSYVFSRRFVSTNKEEEKKEVIANEQA